MGEWRRLDMEDLKAELTSMARDKASPAASVGICVGPPHLRPAGANAQAETPRKRHLDCTAGIVIHCSPLFRLAVPGSQNDSSFLAVEEALLLYKF